MIIIRVDFLFLGLKKSSHLISSHPDDVFRPSLKERTVWIRAGLAVDCRGETLDTPELLTPKALFIQLRHCLESVGVLHFQPVSVTRSGHWADRRWRKWYWHYQASVRRCVKCAHGPVTDIFTWIYHLVAPHAFFCLGSPLTTLLKEKKKKLSPVAISFYLGTFAQTGMLACKTWAPLFLSLCGTLHPGSLLCHSSVAAWLTTLLAICNIFIWNLSYSTLYLLWSEHQLQPSCRFQHVESHICNFLSVAIMFFSLHSVIKSRFWVSWVWVSVVPTARCIFHVWLQEAWPCNRVTHQHSQEYCKHFKTEGSTTSDISQTESMIRTLCTEGIKYTVDIC